MNRAITFCAIALGIPAMTCAAVESYMSTRSVVPGIHADNGLECHVTEQTYPYITHPDKFKNPNNNTPFVAGDTWQIELISGNRFRVVDNLTQPQALAKDIFGAVTVTDATYTLGDPSDPPNVNESRGIDDITYNIFSGIVIDRLNGAMIGKFTLHYGKNLLGDKLPDDDVEIRGYCTATYVAPRVMPKKL
jgi:hypothetical protein